MTAQVYAANVASSTRLVIQATWAQYGGGESVLIQSDAPIGQTYATMFGAIPHVFNVNDNINVKIFSDIPLTSSGNSVKLNIMRIK